MVGAHWMSPGAEVSPPLVWGALWWTWIALWPTREHLRPLPWSFRVGNTPEVRALRSGTTTTLLGRSSRALRPNLAFKVCSHGLLIAMVSRWPTTPRLAGHPSSLFFLLSSSSLSPLLLTLLTLEFCIEVPDAMRSQNTNPSNVRSSNRHYFFLKWCSGSLSPGKEECSLFKSSLLPLPPSLPIKPA